MADRLNAFNGDESLRAPEPFCVRLRALNAVKALDLSPLILDNRGRGRPVLFDLRDLLLTELPMAPRTPSRGGRPWVWKQAAETALKDAGVVAADIGELVSALGFLDDE